MGHVPRPVRYAAICTSKECVPPIRVFLTSEEQAQGWRCPEHGVGRVQANR